MRTKNSYSLSKTKRSSTRNLWSIIRTLGCAVINLSNSASCRNFPIKYFFHGYITSYSSRCPKISAIRTTRNSLFLTWLNLEIFDATLPQRVERNNPRVVKKPVSKFKSKKVKHRGTGIKINSPVFNILKPPNP